ncbi:MAG: hypothetical protein HQ593_05785 [Candidatus Omnitrophica bacterium]|nr:hypothetical protein [Candidatus Omnitrophota bacterium]
MTVSRDFIYRITFMAVICLLVAVIGLMAGLEPRQVMALSIFSISILGTLLFWHFRLSFAFFGSSLFLITHLVELEDFIKFCSMEIILFLIGMMILVGFLKELGFFTWLLSRALCLKNLNAKKFIIALTFTSAILAALIDEVSSIVFMVMLIFEICDYFEVNPIPFIIASVLATNIGSTGTVIGNPIGLFIAAKASLTFEDFIVHAFPLMILSLFILLAIFFVVFKKPLKELDEKIKELGPNDFLVQLLNVPPEKNLRIGFFILGITLCIIGFHHRIEVLLGLKTNTILLIAPLVSASVIMVWRREHARNYIEKDVEWWSLLFFMFLFGQAGTLAHIGVTEAIAGKIIALVAGSKIALISVILVGGAFVSSILDNVVVVASLIPVIKNLNAMVELNGVLWWALLFGACFGGNMTIIGSTANIVAIGMLEKRGLTIGFMRWFRIGILVGLITLLFILGALILLYR